MVGCLSTLFKYLDWTARLLRHVAQQVGEQLASDQSRARTRDQDSVGFEHSQGSHVQPQIALERMFDVFRLAQTWAGRR